jgi:serine/threonine-protein kinase
VGRYRDIKPLGSVAPQLPNYVIAMVNKTIEFRPERRIQTPAELLDELRNVMRRYDAGDSGAQPTDENEEALPVEAGTDSAEPELPQEGESRTVMIVEPNVEMHETYRKALKKRGYRVLLTTDPNRGYQRFEDHHESEPLADCIVINSQRGGETAVDVFNRFGTNEATRDLPAILLVDPDRKDLIQAAQTNGHRVLLAAPITVKKLRAALLKLLHRRQGMEAAG